MATASIHPSIAHTRSMTMTTSIIEESTSHAYKHIDNIIFYTQRAFLPQPPRLKRISCLPLSTVLGPNVSPCSLCSALVPRTSEHHLRLAPAAHHPSPAAADITAPISKPSAYQDAFRARVPSRGCPTPHRASDSRPSLPPPPILICPPKSRMSTRPRRIFPSWP